MYTTSRCRYATTDGTTVCGYVIESDSATPADLMWVNRYLHKLSKKSDLTAYQYARRLIKFFDFLEKAGKTYHDCTDEDIVRYMHSLQYDTSSKIVCIAEQRLSPQALAAYYFPVRGFYVYLYNCRQPVKVDIQLVTRRSRDSYLQGIAPAMQAPDLVLDSAYERGAPVREYIRWYTEEEKLALLNGFRTLRDRAICSISMDGFRIDEILSSRGCDYDKDRALLTPYRSKRKIDGAEDRMAPLSDRSVCLLEGYLINERAVVEIELEEQGRRMPDELFVVLRHGKNMGKPITYNAFWQNLKTAARRAGFDETRIRTHSGRSTRANEVFTDMAKNPGKWSEREILDLFGWASMESAKPYINRNDPDRMMAVAEKLKELDARRRERREQEDGN